MRTLFDITQEMLRLADIFGDATTGEIGEDEAAILESYFQDLVEGEQAKKLDGYCNLYFELKTRSEVAADMARVFGEKSRIAGDKAKYLKDRIHIHLDLTQQKKAISASGYVVSIQNNGGRFPVKIVDGTDPEKIPEEFRKVTTTIDMEKLYAHLETGGVVDFASLEPRKTHCRIK